MMAGDEEPGLGEVTTSERSPVPPPPPHCPGSGKGPSLCRLDEASHWHLEQPKFCLQRPLSAREHKTHPSREDRVYSWARRA